MPMLGRRVFLGGVSAAIAGAGAGAGAGIAIAKVPDGSEPHPLPASAESGAAGDVGGAVVSLGRAGVRAGAVFGTCAVTVVASKDDGAVAVALADAAGRGFELELLGHDPHTPGVARGGSLAVYLNNQGRGVTATVEEHGLAAMALAAHLAQREADGVELPALPTLTERLSLSPALRAV